MEEEKAKKILENMLMNDVPMSSIGGLFLIRDGKILDESEDKPDECYKEIIILRDIYRNIDTSLLTNETGKSIIERTKPLIEEYFDTWVGLWNTYVSSGFKAQKVPKRLFEIGEEISRSTRGYEGLEGQKLYRKAWRVGYFTQNCGTRTNWFFAGKPTKIHPEKLKLVLGEIKNANTTKKNKNRI